MSNLRPCLAHHEMVEGKQLSPLDGLPECVAVAASRVRADPLNDPGSARHGFFLSDIYAARFQPA